MLLLTIQIALGGWVSTNYAALACTDFPLCQGALFPQMDFANGFTLWRDLGMTASGDYLLSRGIPRSTGRIALSPLIVIVLVAWVALRSFKIDALRKTARWLLAVVALQFVTGVSTVFLNYPGAGGDPQWRRCTPRAIAGHVKL